MPQTDQYWALPDGISEALPDEAERLEQLRRELLDLYATWGYRMVMPPLVEFMESLRTGHGTHLDVQTFKLTDQLSGRMMGVRADMTPQIARIDAHKLKTEHPNRLCYIGSVLRTRAFHRDSSRSPLQVGAELFGHAGLDSDAEVISLLLETLQHSRVTDVVLDIGHVGIFRTLAREAQFTSQQERAFYNMLERKSLPEIETWLHNANLPLAMCEWLRRLPCLHGDASVLVQARDIYANAHPDIRAALDYLGTLVERINAQFPSCTLHIDLAELSGYDYHTGITYAVYVPGIGREIARGGRYDGIGEAFGRVRPATGFSTDLRALAKFAYRAAMPTTTPLIFAPAQQDQQLERQIRTLRQQGLHIIRGLTDSSATPQDLGCTQQLLQQHDGTWQVVAV